MAKQRTYPNGGRKAAPARQRHDRRRKAKRMGPLADWLKRSKTTLSALAGTLDVSVQHVSNIVHGHTRPGMDVAAAIERATDGAVPMATWSVD